MYTIPMVGSSIGIKEDTREEQNDKRPELVGNTR